MIKLSNIWRILPVLFIIFSFAGASEAAVIENSLKISLIKYDPYPVNPDSDFSIWVSVKNVGDNDVSAASVEFVPKYPFTVKAGENAVKYPGTIRKSDELVLRYNLHADKNAFVGTNTIEVGYRIDGVFTKREFDIEVGNDVVDARGTVRLEKYTIYPETLMPGDTATVALTIKNSASQYTIKLDGRDYSMNAQIQSAELIGNEVIDVISEPYYNMGIVGPGDSVELLYSVKVKENTPDGIYFLDFNLKGSARLYSLNLKIPVRVDSSSIKTSLSETPKLNQDKIILNVANNRPNAIQAATVLPAGNATFEPAEYFIGTMDPDELFTVKFDLNVNNPQEDINFRIRFKNGNNWHEIEALTVMLDGPEDTKTLSADTSSILPVIAIFAVLIVISVFFVLMRRRRAKSE
ncbi:hypothetical protein ANME2D_01835 [Candidatus Methanoperedens nitroreducens]|uniref:S-layer domain-containing protein n=1 Tax=Candidatus Methanoperedens nitratireducens TaxID=1392998 RepID=A0A062V8T3_9EURY|nr:COG1361 S-layer family protein [Candidatus Methanoperedens nitroreducens]KCZ71780.1 hypothetical protein ANME2D_01835 [Candidatus Methanoperedens nitroreducens]MDJ1422246.1 COG1361 S-layer family protein [Candidatus Methanoperedens sp.]